MQLGIERSGSDRDKKNRGRGADNYAHPVQRQARNIKLYVRDGASIANNAGGD